MPQMSPMLWFWLFLYNFIFFFLMVMILNFYFLYKNNLKHKYLFNNFKWFW